MLGETVALNLSSASPYQSSVITTNPQHTPQSFCMQAFPWQLWCGGACLATRSLFLLPILLMACRFAERAGWRLVADKRSCVYLMLLLYGSKGRELSAAAHVLMFPVCLGQKCHFQNTSFIFVWCFLNEDGWFEGGSAVLPTLKCICLFCMCSMWYYSEHNGGDDLCSNTAVNEWMNEWLRLSGPRWWSHLAPPGVQRKWLNTKDGNIQVCGNI